MINSYEGKPLKLFVYNSEADNCREVTIIPNSYVSVLVIFVFWHYFFYSLDFGEDREV